MHVDFRQTAIGRIGITECGGSLSGLCFGASLSPQRHQPVDTPLLGEAFRQLDAWLAGEITAFSLPLAPRGTEFMLRVWAALQEIPYGHTSTYRDIADGLGSPGAARAVGMACAKNPLPIFIPCHRVIRSDGKTGGYLGGAGIKSRLLALERRKQA
ncbi:MAG: methylated-DNA--[protein]-cysteine S-methyltransferase [Chlorobiaceae bacterium]|nr:methylated-DNA--[protein]-cysteine S-methyltransferase [Chlorobiaceae bacterium]